MDICRQAVGTDEKKIGELFSCLVALVKILRSEKGCPWDRKQTLADVKEFLLEEVYELISAIEEKDWIEVEEEVGDVLLLAAFLSRIGEEMGLFSLEGSLKEVISKLVRRHPHVFGDMRLEDADEVIANWTKIKETEKKQKGKQEGPWASVPKKAPSLFQYYTYLKELKKRGISSLEKDESELKKELTEIISRQNFDEEDLVNALSKLVEICYIKGIEPEMMFLKRIIDMRSQGGGG